MGEAHLTRPWNRTAPNQPGITDRMMGRTEWTGREQSTGIGIPGNTVDLRRLERLLEGDRRQDSRNSLGKHRLA